MSEWKKSKSRDIESQKLEIITIIRGITIYSNEIIRNYEDKIANIILPWEFLKFYMAFDKKTRFFKILVKIAIIKQGFLRKRAK